MLSEQELANCAQIVKGLEDTEAFFALDKLIDLEDTRLYRNASGYSTEALDITDKVVLFAQTIMEEYPQHSLMELAGIMYGAITEAQCLVGINRNMKA